MAHAEKSNPWAQQIGSRIEILLRLERWTRDELVRRSGVQDKQLRRYLTGTHVPRAEALRALADAFGVSVDWLLSGIEESPPAAFFLWRESHPDEDLRAVEVLRKLPTYGRRVGPDFYSRALHAWQEGKTFEEVAQAAHTRIDRV